MGRETERGGEKAKRGEGRERDESHGKGERDLERD